MFDVCDLNISLLFDDRDIDGPLSPDVCDIEGLLWFDVVILLVHCCSLFVILILHCDLKIVFENHLAPIFLLFLQLSHLDFRDLLVFYRHQLSI